MTEKSVIIVGAGLAGLAAGCFAQLNGYQSHIFEHHSQPGGVAAAWKRNEYLIDGGIHFLMGHKPGTGLHELYQQVGIMPDLDVSDLTTYGRFVDEKTGFSLTVSQDLDKLARDLKEAFPADARIADELVAVAHAMQGTDMSEMGLSKPPELTSAMDQLKDLWSMRRMLKYVVGKYGRPVEEYVQDVEDPTLRSFIKGLFLPEVPVYFLGMLLALLADGQLGLIQGGCLEFARAMERRYLELGGQITYRARVEEILVEGNRAVGVRLADNSDGPREHRAGAIISAADGKSTIFEMLGGRYANDKIRERYATWPRFRPLLMISYGVARTFPEEPPFLTFALAEPMTIAQEETTGLMVRIFNYSPHFAPEGKAVIQAELETGWDYWNDLQSQDRAAYESAKEKAAAVVLERLEAHFPGLAAQVEVTDVATPYTTWRYTLNDRGAWEGWLMMPETIRTTIERTLPGLERFYMAGQWVMPGGGVPPCLYSGRHAIQILCQQDGTDLTTEQRRRR